jgi:hypothetical protein
MHSHPAHSIPTTATDSAGNHQPLVVPLWRYGAQADLVLVCVVAVEDCQAMQVDIQEKA